MLDPAARTQRTHALLDRIEGGDAGASRELLAIVYAELHELAERALRGERGHTLQPTALVNEACVRLLGAASRRHWESTAHVLAVAAKSMRSILVDHARRKRAEKRAGAGERVDIEGSEELVGERGPELDLCALDAALEKLATVDADLAAIVELRFFGGLSVEDVARARGVSEPTIVRGWRVARLFLLKELEAG